MLAGDWPHIDIIVTILSKISLTLAAACTLLGQPYDFGHRTHLTMRLACARCHPGIQTRSQPGAADEARFSSDACLDCHGRAILNLKPGPAPPIAHFSHALHVNLKGVTCERCHQGLLESDKVTDALFPRMADCQACHKEATPPGNCTLCHATDDPRLQSQKRAPETSQSR